MSRAHERAVALLARVDAAIASLERSAGTVPAGPMTFVDGQRVDAPNDQLELEREIARHLAFLREMRPTLVEIVTATDQ